jgi:hypothetical protein
LKAIINNNNYGREATAFLTARQNNGILLDYWEQQLRQRTVGNNNYNNYGREAAAFLKGGTATTANWARPFF